MIPAPIYSTTYFIILSIIILIGVLPLLVKRNLSSFPAININIGISMLLLITIVFIGFRDPWGASKYFGDTTSYTKFYYRLQSETYLNITKDIGFYLFMRLSGLFLNVSVFYTICAILYVLPVYYAFKKWFDKYALFALILFVGSMSFWAYGINGVRNGLATSLFIYALAVERKVVRFSIFLLAFSFHSSIIMPAIAYFIAKSYKNTKAYITIWALMIPISFFFGNNLEVFISNVLKSIGLFDAGRIENLYSNRFEIITRAFRLDFLIYSAIPIILGYWYVYKKQYKNEFYILLLNIYIIVNTIWVLMIYAAFTNRIAYLSWFLYPIILCYPILLKDHRLSLRYENKMLLFMILASLGFTLLLEFK